MDVYVVQAKPRVWPVSDGDGAPVDAATLPLSDRLLAALWDWAQFFDQEIADRAPSDPGKASEFNAQGLRLARRMREELPGRTIYFVDLSGEKTLIEKRKPPP